MSLTKFLLIGATVLCLSACGANRVVQPLNKSQWQTSVSFGGPLLKSDDQKTEITPLSAVSAAYGFSQSLTGFASWHLTSFLNDVYHLDVGFTHELLPPFSTQPGITYSGLLNLFSEKGGNESRVYPQIDVNAYWLLANKDFIYTGFSNWFELSSEKAHGEKQQQHWFTSLNLGYTKNIRLYSASIELKYLAPLKKSDERLVNFTNLDSRGAVGLYFSIARKF